MPVWRGSSGPVMRLFAVAKCQRVVWVCVGVCWLTLLLVSDVRSAPTQRIKPEGITGSLVLAGGGSLPDPILGKFIELAGGDQARVVVISTASARADELRAEDLRSRWEKWKIASFTVFHARTKEQANDPQFLKPLREATGIWFMGGQQSRLAQRYVGTQAAAELRAVLDRRGVIGGTSAGAAIMSRVMIARGNPVPELSQGLGLLPGVIVDQHFLKRGRQDRLRAALVQHPGLVGMGIDEGTALIVRGRRIDVLGKSTVTAMLAAGAQRQAVQEELSAGRPYDLTAFRRAARDRVSAVFPPPEPEVARVPQGSLVIVGGGGLPSEIVKKFIELAGGPEALIVVLPTAIPDAEARRTKTPEFLKRAGAKNVRVLPHRRLDEVESDEFLEALGQAGGVWFGGGRQWRFVDAYSETRAEAALKAVLQRGGVIGGSSAGASIQASFLARGNPLGNRDIIARGYERGLGFLPGTAIDQHFTQRKRLSDMSFLVKRHPQLLGIGIDEATALVVRGQIANVIGRNRVYFYNRQGPMADDGMYYEVLKSGASYDLKDRRVVSPGN